jgi:hypothetical protein
VNNCSNEPWANNQSWSQQTQQPWSQQTQQKAAQAAAEVAEPQTSFTMYQPLWKHPRNGRTHFTGEDVADMCICIIGEQQLGYEDNESQWRKTD